MIGNCWHGSVGQSSVGIVESQATVTIVAKGIPCQVGVEPSHGVETPRVVQVVPEAKVRIVQSAVPSWDREVDIAVGVLSGVDAADRVGELAWHVDVGAADSSSSPVEAVWQGDLQLGLAISLGLPHTEADQRA